MSKCPGIVGLTSFFSSSWHARESRQHGRESRDAPAQIVNDGKKPANPTRPNVYAKRVARESEYREEIAYKQFFEDTESQRQATFRSPTSQPTKHSLVVTLSCRLPTGSPHPRLATYVKILKEFLTTGAEPVEINL